MLQASGLAQGNVGTIGTSAHPVFAGTGPSIELNPESTVNGLFSRPWTPTDGALGLGTLGEGFAAILGHNGNTLLSGVPFTSYADSVQGQRHVANQISFMLGLTSSEPEINPVPAPSVVSLLVIGLIAIGLRCRRRW